MNTATAEDQDSVVSDPILSDELMSIFDDIEYVEYVDIAPADIKHVVARGKDIALLHNGEIRSVLLSKITTLRLVSLAKAAQDFAGDDFSETSGNSAPKKEEKLYTFEQILEIL